MILQKKVINFWGFPWFFLAVFLFVSVFAVQGYFDWRNDPRHVFKEFQKQIHETEFAVKKRVDQLVSEFDTVAGQNFKTKSTLSADPAEMDQILLFVYKDDSLVFWNNNKVILPAHFGMTEGSRHFASLLKNGWYEFRTTKKGDFSFIGGYLVKSRYNFQNDYLQNGFSPLFDFPASLSLTEKMGPYAIYSADRSYLFSLGFEKYRPDIMIITGLTFLLFMCGSLCFFYFIFLVISRMALFRDRRILRFVVFVFALVILRIIQCYWGFPGAIYQSDLFGPALYSSSAFLPSLGDLILNVTILLAIALAFNSHGTFTPGPKSYSVLKQIGRAVAMLTVVIMSLHVVGYFLEDLVINSSLPLNLQNISGLTKYSFFGLYIITAFFASLWLFSVRLFDECITAINGKWIILSAMVTACLYFLAGHFAFGGGDITIVVFFLVYIAVYWYVKIKTRVLFSVQGFLLFLFFYAILGTVLLNRDNQVKEKEKLNLLAAKLATRRNPVTEVLYEQVERKLLADTNIAGMIRKGNKDRLFNQDSLGKYLKNQYFRDYWQKYQIQVTLCDPGKDLRIQPQGYRVNCNSYFQGIIDDYGESTTLPNLFFLDYGIGKEYYLAVFPGMPGKRQNEDKAAVFIEFNLRNSLPDPGYPGLLMDKSRVDMPNLSEYSYGMYQSGKLIRAVGTVDYKMDLVQYKKYSVMKPFFSEDGKIHFFYRVNKTDAMLLSKKEDDFLSLATPFPYLFILFSVIVLLASAIWQFPKHISPVPVSLRNRLHFFLIGILVLTMIAIGVLQALYIIQINSKKNVDNLREKAFSVVVEVQHKYSSKPVISDVNKSDLEDFLVKLSNVFFTDINIFDNNGILVSSSRPQIFDEGLMSERMNPAACRKMIGEKSSIYIHNESIGNMQFNSAYLPFFSDNNELLGFVNLPYFAKQDESKKEISSFLVTFINIYIILLLFGVVVTALITKYITAPLGMLATKMSQLRFGTVNEKIAWSQKDEIGQLVMEYNRMIDELGRSAELLARSERESAWREMARQVAHEIKNPLTPMKLSTQHLEKAWDEKAPDWGQRLARYTKSMVEQIDALSVIASDFSAFAKMPEVVPEKVDIENVIRYVLSLYQDTIPIRFELLAEVPETVILADRQQMIRVFTNLLNNAVQAIDDPAAGIIRITLSKEYQHVVIRISDNGCGIPEDRRDKIFQPDFTTKTGGMGLGLAIVKSIVTAMKGEITFISGEKSGTIFILKFQPNVQEKK